MYGLACEHTLEDLTIWNGNGGQTFFYQSELPYDVDQESFGDKGFVGYSVAPNVTSHKAFGVGVYCFFRDHSVTVSSGTRAPKALESQLENPFIVKLSGNFGIQHVVNDLGPAASVNGQARYLQQRVEPVALVPTLLTSQIDRSSEKRTEKRTEANSRQVARA